MQRRKRLTERMKSIVLAARRNKGKILGATALAGLLGYSIYHDIETARMSREVLEREQAYHERVRIENEKVEKQNREQYHQRAQRGRKEGHRFVNKIKRELELFNTVERKFEKPEQRRHREEREEIVRRGNGDPVFLDQIQGELVNTYYFFPYLVLSKEPFMKTAGETLFRAGKTRGEALAVFYLSLRARGYPSENAWASAEANVEIQYDPLVK